MVLFNFYLVGKTYFAEFIDKNVKFMVNLKNCKKWHLFNCNFKAFRVILEAWFITKKSFVIKSWYNKVTFITKIFMLRKFAKFLYNWAIFNSKYLHCRTIFWAETTFNRFFMKFCICDMHHWSLHAPHRLKFGTGEAWQVFYSQKCYENLSLN